MKRVLGALVILSATSGCYTVLRHPQVERSASGTFYEESVYSLGPMQDCAACHETWDSGGFDPWLPPYGPWVAYGTGPWWERTGIEQAQGRALANDRPRPPIESSRPVAIDVAVPGTAAVVKPAAPGLAATEARGPHPGRTSDPGLPVSASGGREAGRADAPRTPPARSASPAAAPRPQESQPTVSPQGQAAAPPVANATAPRPQSASLTNTRPRPQ